MVIESSDITDIKLQILQFIDDNPVYICGISALGKVMSQWMDYHGIDYEGFVDRRGRADWTDKIVLTYQDIQKSDYGNSRFIVTQKLYRREVEEDLLQSGVSKENILQFQDEATFECLYYDLVPVSDCLKEVLQLKNIHYGERCFVIGNGPSLLEKDINKIKKEHCFAVNMMYENFTRLDWKPSFYIVYDRAMSMIFEKDDLLFKQTLKNVGQFIVEYKTGLYAKYYKKKPSNLIFYKDITQRINKDGRYSFSDDMLQGLYRGQTVIYAALQMAVYMGFKKIYLLGVDMSYQRERKRNGKTYIYSETRKNHADFVREPDIFENDAFEMVDEMEANYKAAKEYADKHSIEIYNATRGGKLEVFTRVNFDELFD